MSRDEMVKLVRRCARKLGRSPTLRDLHGVPGFQERVLYQHFTGIGEVLKAAGRKAVFRNSRASSEELLLDWAEVARKLKRLPSAAQYRRAGRFTGRPLARRFGGWERVPQAFRRFARQMRIEKQWAEVLRMIAVKERSGKGRTGPVKSLLSGRANEEGFGLRQLLPGRPVYGAPLLLPGLAHAPVNEAGVVYLFGVIAGTLGFIVERMQAEFPDCEALYEAEPGRWQRVRIEFEYASRNFLNHGHRAHECDMIVCWVHDWEECPKELQVVELRSVIG